MNVRVSNGKYTFVKRDVRTLEIEVQRHGRPWVILAPAFNALHSIMCELDAARVVVAAARKLGDHAPRAIRDALTHHASLVDDREAPSPWCGEPAPGCAPDPIDWRQRVLELEEKLALMTGPTCDGCGRSIDPDCCWCGSVPPCYDHVSVPMGCACSQHERDWQGTASDLRVLLWQARREIVELRSQLLARPIGNGTEIAA